ncbi:MAG: PEP-CTERM sorting domain-containing protein [Cyanobacteria bacterium P01_D01_bin.123]
MNLFCRLVGSGLRVCSLPLALAATTFVAQSASAAILTTTGDVAIAPNPVVAADYPNGSTIFAIAEAASIAFPAGVNLSLGTIPEGRLVDSYLLHYDPNPNVRTVVTGSIEFSQPILGYVWQSNRLDATDALFNAVMPVGTSRGLENRDLNASALAIGTSIIDLDFRAGSTGIDNVRVFVAAPEPATTAGLATLGVLGFGAICKRRRQAALPTNE